jgi:hypothetical protein
MNLKDVVTFIITDSSVKDSGMDAVITAIRERQKINRQTQKVVAQAVLHIGTNVTVKDIRPKFLTGMKGTIVAFNNTRSRADIRITDNLGNRKIPVGTIKHGFPITCLDEIYTAPKSVITDEDEGVLYDFMRGEL